MVNKSDVTEVSSETAGMLQGSVCRACGRGAMWRSWNGLLLCWACHPPASLELVKEVIDMEAA